MPVDSCDVIVDLIRSLERTTLSLPRVLQTLVDYQNSRDRDPEQAQFDQELFRETSLYGEYVHPDILFMIKTVVNIVEWCLATAQLNSTALADDLLLDCEKSKFLADKLAVNYTTVLTRFERLRSRIAFEKGRALATTGRSMFGRSPLPIKYNELHDSRPAPRKHCVAIVLSVISIGRARSRRPSSVDPTSPRSQMSPAFTMEDAIGWSMIQNLEQQLEETIESFRDLAISVKPFVCAIEKQLLGREETGRRGGEPMGYAIYEKVVLNGGVIIRDGKTLLAEWMSPESGIIKRRHIIQTLDRENYLRALDSGSDKIKVIYRG